jgi:hypothetical protein
MDQKRAPTGEDEPPRAKTQVTIDRRKETERGFKVAPDHRFVCGSVTTTFLVGIVEPRANTT